ncbi:bifunctional 4-hydroxy-2-oxoglutarate aldolase/2-dehydro-3-deoxy-phosphogluconate aldolase [Mycolicibacterium septicum DSM 44393]|uniref:Bifunctional 4-hydroxy-2-oxoglutarate aldolase/2-dehydro-3-deoxy-phosphogluconate aldolase n=1 Tax=Mycolicibacterium septicum DSM 44393 TaxID=1341646 RepID=A0A7X6MNJ7_9MYCO|nr:bifunctional 4-hydroxy-2-oxoglutarate aldolase/2-dehydro-3-deoxy-phosphogluconate aldolase [Mycolicibacterium septicum]NKZ11915.1 bifunctional 4-hydroxy-2-oxoglutarate aldolase/2-dehydro-3-deoxy-phosphogluconate aldolase [Mycolicibacterium septicum DSM 44393]
MTALDVLRSDRVLSVVRAETIPDAADLCHALAEGGIRTVELTFTTPGVLDHLRSCAESVSEAGIMLGVGTVMTADQARAAIDAGARFLVTPGLRPEVAEVATAYSVPVFLGALTPTEVAQAVDLGSAAVKIFPAGSVGPKYLSDLHGPYPEVELLPSGGINEGNARSYLDAGALAVCAGTGVVPPARVAAGDWDEITGRARSFVAALSH